MFEPVDCGSTRVPPGGPGVPILGWLDGGYRGCYTDTTVRTTVGREPSPGEEDIEVVTVGIESSRGEEAANRYPTFCEWKYSIRTLHTNPTVKVSN